MDNPFLFSSKRYVCIECSNADRIIRLFINNKIELSELKYNKEYITGYIPCSDYKRLCVLCKKARIRIQSGSFKGPAELISHLKQGWYYIFLLSVTAIIYIYLNSLILTIQINGNYYYTDELITDYLKAKSITLFSKRKDCDTEKLNKDIRKDFEYVVWCDSQINGNNLYINLLEDYTSLNEKYADDSIKSKVYGKIDSIMLKSGTSLKKIGDEVVPGEEIIISESVIKNIYGEEITKIDETADADIRISFTTKVIFSTPLNIEIKQKTNKIKRGLDIYGKTKFFSYQPYIYDDKYDIITEKVDIYAFGKIKLPIYINTTKYYTTNKISITLSAEEAQDLLLEKAELKDKEYILKGYNIIDKNTDFYIKDDEVILSVTYNLSGNATDSR